MIGGPLPKRGGTEDAEEDAEKRAEIGPVHRRGAGALRIAEEG